MSIEAIIFDLDGVLVHTDNYHYMAWKKVADGLGIAFNQEKNNALRGVSRAQSLDILLSYASMALPLNEKARIMEEKNNIYRSLLNGLSHAHVSAQVTLTLSELRQRGYKLAVASSSKNARFIMEKTGLCGFFTAVADGTTTTNTKPHPEVFLSAAALLGVAPSCCLVVEDAVVGIQAACSAGMQSCAIGDAKTQQAATYKIDNIQELLGIACIKKHRKT